MKISVIIPVYNSCIYLGACIDSIRKQSYQNVEIILVDDGSNDGSEKVCDQFAEEDKRIIVIHQKNGGTSAARNTGLRVATGDYIMFMDNDDYWNDTLCLESIVRQLEESNADVLMFSTIDYWQNKEQYVYPDKKGDRERVFGKSKEQALEYLIENGLLYRAVWSKVIKKEMIEKNSLYFVEGIRNEDSEWTGKMMLCADSYDWYEKPFYIYRKGHEGAQTSKPNTYRTVLDLKEIIIKYVKIAQKNKNVWSKEFLHVYLSYFSYLFSVWMAQAELLNHPEILQDKKEMKKYAHLLNYDLDPSVRLVRKVYGLCGYHITAKMLKVYMKRKYHVCDA